MLLIPCVGALFQLVAFVYLVQRFDKGLGHYLGVVLLPFVFLPILGFGSAQYHPPFVPRARRRRTAAGRRRLAGSAERGRERRE